MSDLFNPPRPKGNAAVNEGIHQVALKAVRGRRANFSYYLVVWTHATETHFRISRAQFTLMQQAGIVQVDQGGAV